MARRPKPLPTPARPPRPKRKPRPRPTPEPAPRPTPEPSKKGAEAPPSPEPEPESVGGLNVTAAGLLGAQEVSWILPGVLPSASIVLLEGDPGSGKSVLAADLAAAVSTGREWAGRPVTEAGPVVIMAAEDDPRSTIRPRLISAGADLMRVHLITWETGERRRERPTIPACAGDLAELLTRCRARLLILDTLGSMVGPGISLNDTAGAEDYMAALRWVCSHSGASVLAIRHHNKATTQRALHRGSGSIAITGAARVVLALARGANKSTGVLAGVKSNMGPLPEPEAYRLEPDGLSVRVRWLGRPEESIEELMAAGAADPGDRCKRELAEEIIRSLVGDSWTPAQTIFDAARDHGIGERTVWSARARLGCRSRPATGGAKQRWEWGPPEGGFKLAQP